MRKLEVHGLWASAASAVVKALREYETVCICFQLLASEKAFDVVQTAFRGEKTFLTAFEFDADEAVETVLLDD